MPTMLKLAADENFNNNIDPFAPIGRVIEDVLLLAEASVEGECKNLIGYMPLR